MLLFPRTLINVNAAFPLASCNSHEGHDRKSDPWFDTRCAAGIRRVRWRDSGNNAALSSVAVIRRVTSIIAESSLSLVLLAFAMGRFYGCFSCLDVEVPPV